ncbi:MAG: phage portal protein [Pseudoalteromonadaceae bacterium]|nr:phage portal protein [Pseudoalteromonadaceae bacterium]
MWSSLFTPTSTSSSSSNFTGTSGWGSNRGSKAGVAINEDTALAQSVVARCVTLLASELGKMPCEVYKRNGDQRDKAPEHPLYNLLKYQPNQKDTAFEYFERGQGFLGLNGNHLAFIDRKRNHEIKELIPIHRDKVIILKGSDGLPYYKIPEWDNQVFTMREIHHVKGFSRDGFQGESPLQTSADTIGLALAQEEYAAKAFSNGLAISGVITRPKEAGQIETQAGIDNLVNGFTDRHSGLRNAFSVALLQEGMDYKQLAQNHQQAQLIEARKASIADICRLYGVPLSMVFESSGESYKSVEQNTLNYLMFAVMPWLKRWEQAMHRDLLSPSEKSTHLIEFNFNSLIRGDMETRFKSYALGRQWGWLSINDIRRMENLPPVEGGDIYLAPLNMVDSKNMDVHQKIEQATEEQIKEIELLCRR